MTRRPTPLPWVLGLTLLLAACSPTTPPVVTPPDQTTPPGTGLKPATLGAQTVALGTALSATVDTDFSGTWEVRDRPDWLSLSRFAGQGNLNLTVTADRSKAAPLAADQAQLTGVIRVAWQSGTGNQARAGLTDLKVVADQYRLTGRVLTPQAVRGQDIAANPAAVPGRAVPGGAAPSGAQTSGQVAGSVIVKYRLSPAGSLAAQSVQTVQTVTAPARQGQATLEAAGVAFTSAQNLSAHLASLRVTDVAGALAALRADPNVEYAVPSDRLHALGLAQPVTPGDQYAPLQWPFKLLGYPAVWRDMESGGYQTAVTVAVIDSGVRYDHPDLAGQVWTGSQGALDVVPRYVDTAQTKDNGDGDGPDTDPTDPGYPGRTLGSHGTHVTGLIVARWGQNAPSCAGCSPTGVVGAAYKANVKVLPIRALDAYGDTDTPQIVQAVRYAAGLPTELDGKLRVNPHPAQVINLSLGGDISAESAQPMCDAIQEARAAGSLVLAAAGNAGTTRPYYPAACPAAVAVGSVTLSGGSAPKRAVYSNAYAAVNLSAPGGSGYRLDYQTFNGATLNGQPFPDEVFSTTWNYSLNQPGYEAMSGTSQATPQVAALAALLLSKGVTTTPQNTLNRLVATATDLGPVGRDPAFGSGMINAAAALGAPAVSAAYGLRLQDSRGYVFQPQLDSLGRFQAYLGNGTYSVVAGTDQDGNGVYGETHEARVQKAAQLGPSTPSVDLGELQPQ